MALDFAEHRRAHRSRARKRVGWTKTNSVQKTSRGVGLFLFQVQCSILCAHTFADAFALLHPCDHVNEIKSCEGPQLGLHLLGH